MKIVIDTMGGDNGSNATVGGILKFLDSHKDVEIIAVGDEKELEPLKDKCKIIASSSILPMECSVMQAMRDKQSSMYKAIDALLNENADAIVSCGSTGAFLSLNTLKVKKIDGVLRPALITPFPTKIKGKYTVLLDIGASTENKPEELAQFAKMGQAYCKAVYDNPHPNFYIVSNGAEEGKGTPLTKEAYQICKDYEGFKGYIEGRYIFNGDVDVAVFDGFTGNVFLKGCEGLAKTMSLMIKEAFTSSTSSKIGYLFAKKGFTSFKETMDYKKVGGALLIGVNKIAVKAHGNSTPDSFKCAIEIAYKLAKHDAVNQIKKEFVQ